MDAAHSAKAGAFLPALAVAALPGALHTDVLDPKAILRAQHLAALTASPATRAESEAIAAHVVAHPAFAQAGCIALYAALPGEPDLARVWAAASEKHIVCAAGLKSAPELRSVATLSAMTRSNRGFHEPPAGPSVSPAAVDLWVVPGLSFDGAGIRLGRGGGYYDRLLARRRAGAIALGVLTRRFFSAAPLPRAAHDVPMDALATEAGLHGC